jgi:hypothetical protein
LDSLLLEKLRFTLKQAIAPLQGHPASFIFSSGRSPYLDPKTLSQRLELEWAGLQRFSNSEESLPLSEIFFPSSPFSLTIIPKMARLNDALPEDSPSVLLDLGVEEILRAVLSGDHPPVSPQLFIELLNIYNQRVPELLIMGGPLFKLIIEDQPSLKQEIKNRACAVLINHFEIEALFVFIAGLPELKERDKQILFQSLTAFQKIYRKFLELQEEIGNKDDISLEWFGEDFDRLKKKATFQDNFSTLVARFLTCMLEGRREEVQSLGRYLVLRFNNEDILRQLYGLMQQEASEGKSFPQEEVYLLIYTIMQDFRKKYIPQKVDSALTQTLSEMEDQALESMRLITVGKVPAQLILEGMTREGLPPHEDYCINPSLKEKLQQYHLTFLFGLYPIPARSQEVLFIVSRIAENLELQKEDLVRFIAYLERLLIFLQQLEEMGIRILPGPQYGLILNPFQLSSFSLIEEGAYFSSTGYWLRSRVPPAVIRCISPNAIPNCLGILDRHIFSRVSLLTGAFRGTPFDLDSTNRYDWDEEPENCQIRPGYCLLDIPPLLTGSWAKTQSLQQEALQEKIRKKDWV